MDAQQLIELVRSAYLAGIDDKENGCAQWCTQGSQERAEEIIEEHKADIGD